MSEQTTEPQGNADPGQNQAAAEQRSEWTPPASQADLDRIISDRLTRERAKFADYDDVKQKASRFDELQEAQKTTEQKQAEAIAAAESRAAAAEARLVRTEIQAATGLSAEDMDYFVHGQTREELQASAERFLVRTGLLAEQRAATERRGPAPDPTQGRSSTAVVGSPQEQFAQFLQTQLQKG